MARELVSLTALGCCTANNTSVVPRRPGKAIQVERCSALREEARESHTGRALLGTAQREQKKAAMNDGMKKLDEKKTALLGEGGGTEQKEAVPGAAVAGPGSAGLGCVRSRAS